MEKSIKAYWLFCEQASRYEMEVNTFVNGLKFKKSPNPFFIQFGYKKRKYRPLRYVQSAYAENRNSLKMFIEIFFLKHFFFISLILKNSLYEHHRLYIQIRAALTHYYYSCLFGTRAYLNTVFFLSRKT